MLLFRVQTPIPVIFGGRRAAAVRVQGGVALLRDPGELFGCQDVSAGADKARVLHPALSPFKGSSADTSAAFKGLSLLGFLQAPLRDGFFFFFPLFKSCFKGGIALFSDVSCLTKFG